MTELTIRPAIWEYDGAEIRALCWAYRDLLVERTSGFPGLLDRYYAKADYAALLDDLPRIHARPRGDILVADLGGKVVGSAMYYPLAQPGLTEIKRIFVAPEARGMSAGRALIEDCMRRAVADGYTRMVLDTMIELTEAIRLYEAMGFTPAAPFYDLPDDAAPAIRFFGIDLKPEQG